MQRQPLSYTSNSLHEGVAFLCLVFGVLVGLMMSAAAHAQEVDSPSSSAVVLIIDASGSMWEQLDDGYKIRIAQGALKNVVSELSDDTHIGLIAYGHRRRRDCSDIQTLVPLGSINRATLNREIDALNPVGRTPITASIRKAIDMLAEHDGPASVVLVSDGLETCGGDPCQLVRDTRARGVNVVMHVVGFGVGEVDASQLECTAQAGGGRYISASDAEELAAALRTTVEGPPVGGWLSIAATRDGELMGVAIHVTPSVGGEEAGRGRTYTSPETNPRVRVFPLPAGVYDVQVAAVGVEGDTRRTLAGIEIVDGETVEHVVDFSVGELAVGVTRNGMVSRAGLRVYIAGTTTEVAAGVTYASSSSNPHVFTMTAGTYDVLVRPGEVFRCQKRTAARNLGGTRSAGGCDAHGIERYPPGQRDKRRRIGGGCSLRRRCRRQPRGHPRPYFR